MVTLKNAELTAVFHLRGGELVSLKDRQGCEYIWQADANFWGRHTPVLFPFVGRLKNNRYQYDGASYDMGQHGFARDLEFSVKSQSETAVVFQLTDTEKTRAVYPFAFILELSYTLVDRQLICGYEVKNPQIDAPLYFSIGGHPAFNVPLEPELTFEDYKIEITPKRESEIIPLSGPYSDFENVRREEVDEFLISREAFKEDAFILKTPTATTFTLTSSKGTKKVALSFATGEIDYVGLWSPYPSAAPFVCIEPWVGIADTVAGTGELTKKEGIQKLAPQAEFKRSYTLEFI